MRNIIAIFFCVVAISFSSNAVPRPVVIWHGMGDTCCFPFSMGAIQDAIQEQLPGTYVYSVMIGPDIVTDEIEGFISNANDQIDFACKQFASDTNLSNGFNAIGFSQGSQFLRAYVERCNQPPVYNLITMGGQHQGVADIPDCVSVNESICDVVEEILDLGVYNPIVQETIIQAQYFKDPMDIATYLEQNHFITDINNELPTKNPKYKENLSSLNQLILFQFSEDTVVVPKESEWFGYYEDGDLNKILTLQEMDIYQEDWIGLKSLDESGRLKFLSCPGNHMQISLSWFASNVVAPFLNNSVSTM